MAFPDKDEFLVLFSRVVKYASSPFRRSFVYEFFSVLEDRISPAGVISAGLIYVVMRLITCECSVLNVQIGGHDRRLMLLILPCWFL
jgi:hypothetical protein